MKAGEYKEFSDLLKDLTPSEAADLITVAEAATLRGTQSFAIYGLIERGNLKTVKVADRLFVFKSEVVNYEKKKTGRKTRG